MAASADKTLAPTPRRRQQARDEGRVAQSADLGAAALILGSLAALGSAGGELLAFFAGLLRSHLGGEHWHTWSQHGTGSEMAASQWQALVPELGRLLLPLLGGATLLCLGVHLAQTGLLFRPGRVVPDFERISPISGWQRLWSTDALVNLAFGLVKVVLVAAAAAGSLWQQREELLTLPALDLPTAAGRVWEICLGLALQLALVLLVLAVVDYLLKRWKLERELRMTPEELREEMRQMQGDPQVAARRRQLAGGRSAPPQPSAAGPLNVGPIDPAG